MANTPPRDAGKTLPPQGVGTNKPGGKPSKDAVARSRAIAAGLGGIVSVLMRAPDFRNATIGDLEWLVGPPLAVDQFAIAEGHHAETGIVAPVAIVLWAMVSEEVDKRLSDVATPNPRLEPKDWRSGSIPWVVVAAGDRRALTSLLEQLVKAKFKGAKAKIRVRDTNGQEKVVELGVADAAAPRA